MTSFRRGPLICRAEFEIAPDSPLLRELLELRSLLEDQNVLALRIRETPVELFLFRSRARYTKYVASRFPEAVGRRALFVKEANRPQLFAYRSRQLAVDLRHECTHAWIHNAVDFIPLWLDEGLAEYFEPPSDKRAESSRLSRSRWAARFGWRPSLRSLESRQDLSHMDGAAYRDSWAWVHFLMNESAESRKVLIDYLQEIQRGDPPGPFSQFLRDRMPNAQSRMLHHFRRFQL